MTLQSTTIFQMAGADLRWLGQRQRLIAQNIANSDTPNYQEKDLQPLNFRKVLATKSRAIANTRTHTSHFGSKEDKGVYQTINVRKPFETTPDGNGVNLEEQLVRFNYVQSKHNLDINIIRKFRQIYGMALSTGR